jgi:hypothetical protein
MKAEILLIRLGVGAYTQRHIKIIETFLESGETDAKKLLDQLGGWDENDLSITEKFLTENENKK